MPIPKEEKEIVVIKVDILNLEKRLYNRGSYGLIQVRDVIEILREYIQE